MNQMFIGFLFHALSVRSNGKFSFERSKINEYHAIFRLYFFFVGIQKIMVPGTSVKSSKEALRLSRLYPGIIYSTAGITMKCI